jgi:hypothetical protein
MHVIADSVDEDTVWVLNLQCWKSIDGGRTFTAVPTPHGDNHDLWIDPRDPRRMIEGNDGGACVSFNGGLSWSTLYNQPTAQMYHVTTDTAVPYRVYGSQQDNSAISVASMSYRGAITPQDWYEPGGGESGYIAVHPENPNIVYGGAIGSGEFNGRLIRYDHATGIEQDVTVWPNFQSMGDGADTLKYRFQWTFPLSFSPHNPNELYAAANVLLRSIDEGMTWEEISPDLTRADPDKLVSSGGPITQDNTGAEVYGTIFAFAESVLNPGEFWTGSDDGLVHLSRDGGASWTNITPPDLPPWSLITTIELSPHTPGLAYLCATRYKLDDCAPYLFKTADYGAVWTPITAGIPNGDFTRALRLDPATPGLLFAATETGLWISFDDGEQWGRLRGNLPVVPVYDVVVRDDQLIAATHGRSFWVLDDLALLRRLTESDLSGEPVLFQPPAAARINVYEGWGYKPSDAVNYRHVGTLVAAYRTKTLPDGTTVQCWLDAGENPPHGVVVHYYLPSRPRDRITLSFYDRDDRLIREFRSKAVESALPTTGADDPESEQLPTGEGEEASEPAADTGEISPVVPAEPGLNRSIWDMSYPAPARLPGDKYTEELRGPAALPGNYTVRLVVDGQTLTAGFEIVPNPNNSTSAEGLKEQWDLSISISNEISIVHRAIVKIRDLVGQIDAWISRLSEHADVKSEGRRIKASLAGLEDRLVARNADSPLSPPSRLNAKLAALLVSVQSADVTPTRGQRDVFSELASQVDDVMHDLKTVLDEELPRLNASIASAGMGAIVPRDK